MRHVPYVGIAPALVGLMSGNVAMTFADLAPTVPLIQSGKLKALGAASPERHPGQPGVPAVAETVPGYSAVGSQGVLARSETPDFVIDKINAALVAYLKTSSAAEKQRGIGVDMRWTTPAETRTWVEAQLTIYETIVPSAGILPQ